MTEGEPQYKLSQFMVSTFLYATLAFLCLVLLDSEGCSIRCWNQPVVLSRFAFFDPGNGWETHQPIGRCAFRFHS